MIARYVKSVRSALSFAIFNLPFSLSVFSPAHTLALRDVEVAVPYLLCFRMVSREAGVVRFFAGSRGRTQCALTEQNIFLRKNHIIKRMGDL